MAADYFWVQLLVKTVASALVVVAATLAAEKSGPFWGALIASLPLSAGPIYAMLAIEHDAAFLAESAIGSMAATAATAVYMLALTIICPRLPVLPAISLCLCVWLATTLAIRTLPWTIISATALAVGALLISTALTPDQRKLSITAATRRGPFDIPLRALLVGCLVALVTTFSRKIGPEATGFAAVFPIVMSSLAVILHLRQGGRAVAAIMASSFLPMMGFAVALVLVHTLAPAYGSVLGLTAGLAGSVGWSMLLVGWRITQRRHRPESLDPQSLEK